MLPPFSHPLLFERNAKKINSLTDFPVPLGGEPGRGVAPAEETTLPVVFFNDFDFTAEGAVLIMWFAVLGGVFRV